MVYPNLGMDQPCNIILCTEFHWIELYEDQSINQIVHLDSCCVLDQVVENQFATLLSHYNYTIPLFVVLEEI